MVPWLQPKRFRAAANESVRCNRDTQWHPWVSLRSTAPLFMSNPRDRIRGTLQLSAQAGRRPHLLHRLAAGEWAGVCGSGSPGFSRRAQQARAGWRDRSPYPCPRQDPNPVQTPRQPARVRSARCYCGPTPAESRRADRYCSYMAARRAEDAQGGSRAGNPNGPRKAKCQYPIRIRSSAEGMRAIGRSPATRP